MPEPRDHGGGLDAAIRRYGGTRADWLDLSTGINPVPYPVATTGADIWTALPDAGATDRVITAARAFWNIPDSALVIPASGASALIARMPARADRGAVYIPKPTYNEHAAAFSAQGFEVTDDPTAPTHVYVHPNNPDGRRALPADSAQLTIIDESFCDVILSASLIARTAAPGTIVLKSFGKFWGLAGLRLGFAIGQPETLGGIVDELGPWSVSGPALAIGATALRDINWAAQTRDRLTKDAARLDRMMTAAGHRVVGGTDLFRLYDVGHANALHETLARAHILTRIFPYADTWLRLGLPHGVGWDRLDGALSP